MDYIPTPIIAYLAKQYFSKMSNSYMFNFLIIRNTFLFAGFFVISSMMLTAQTRIVQDVTGNVDSLIDKLYTSENFYARLAHTLDNHPTFLQYSDQSDFTAALTTRISETALTTHYEVLARTLTDRFSSGEIDSLLQILNSPYGDLLIQAFELDNDLIENSIGVYVNSLIEENIHFADPSATKVDLSNFVIEEYEDLVLYFQKELNDEYSNVDTSPLNEEARTKFLEIGGHQFFDINPNLLIEADFKVYDNAEQIELKTSTSRLAEYNVYGKASFVLDGKNLELNVYQSIRMLSDPVYKNYLFIPYTDLTSGEDTYGGGRYIDVLIPSDPSKIMIDFNKSYQPYCAYSDGYSCPIPPAENFLDVKIEGGVKMIDIGHH